MTTKTMPAPMLENLPTGAANADVQSVAEAAKRLWGGNYYSHVTLSHNRTAQGFVESFAMRGDTFGSVAVGVRRYVVENGAARNEFDAPDTRYK